MPNNDINQNHIYETSLLGWAVQEMINGGTDWYTVAAFQHEYAAQKYAEYLSENSDDKYEVSWVGTLHRP